MHALRSTSERATHSLPAVRFSAASQRLDATGRDDNVIIRRYFGDCKRPATGWRLKRRVPKANMSNWWSNFRKECDDLRGHIFTAKFILAIVICPIIGIFLFMGAVSEKGFPRLTFGDLYPAISISLAGVVYFFLYRFLTRPIKLNDDASDGKPRSAVGDQNSRARHESPDSAAPPTAGLHSLPDV